MPADGIFLPSDSGSYTGRWLAATLLPITRVVAYQGQTAVRSMLALRGVAAFPTPTGVFSILRRVPNETMDSMTLGIPHGSPYGYLVKNVLYTQYFTPDGASLHDNWWSSNFGGIGSAPQFFGQGETREQAFALMDAAWDAGITTFDTADAYGGGRSETYIGEWLRTKGSAVRDRIVLSTKVFNAMDDGLDYGLGPDRIRRQLESSLARLGVERVAMYLTHAPDPGVPISETLGGLDELRDAGKIGAAGASNVDGAQLREALAVSATYRWVQNSYSLLDREAEREVLPLCAGHGLGFTPFSPLAGGWLAGRYRRGAAPPPGSRMALRPEPDLDLQRDEVYDALEELERRAAALGVEMAALALAWLLAQPEVTAVVVGPRRPAHLGPALRALELGLSRADAEEVSELFARV